VDNAVDKLSRRYAADVPSRFLTLPDVADELHMSRSQAYALVRGKHLRAVKIGGRGQWRVSREDLESYLQRTYDKTSDWIDKHPYAGGDPDDKAGE
jgi:excisionase family DNA binding protein